MILWPRIHAFIRQPRPAGMGGAEDHQEARAPSGGGRVPTPSTTEGPELISNGRAQQPQQTHAAKFQQLMKLVTELTIDTEERLKGVIDPHHKVQATGSARSHCDFRKAAAEPCQKRVFEERQRTADEIFDEEAERA
uniref:Uncharacterized protein n=1 Tax=Knipowitschia caucasica TaxID=637954 RepID=A0AAV2K2A2_KNICA